MSYYHILLDCPSTPQVVWSLLSIAIGQATNVSLARYLLSRNSFSSLDWTAYAFCFSRRVSFTDTHTCQDSDPGSWDLKSSVVEERRALFWELNFAAVFQVDSLMSHCLGYFSFF